MKHIIFAIVFLVASAGMSGLPNSAQARPHPVRHRVVRRARARRVVYRRRTVYVGSRPHGVNTNATVGVGLGPIHVGVGAGGGIQLHEALPPQHIVPDDPPGDPPAMTPVSATRPEISATGALVAHPSDCDLECYVPRSGAASAAFVDTDAQVIVARSAIAQREVPQRKTENERFMSGNRETYVEPYAPADVRYVQQQFPLSPDVNANDYYATYAPPRVVTVGGFDVAVNPNTTYFDPFKRGRSGLWYVHNRKGVDVTAGYGVSPRAGSIPESIGGSGYTIITVEH